MVWYFQTSPHDTHDWDATQTPVLIDGEIDGQPRKLFGAGQPQRLLLRPRPHQRQEHRDLRVREDELGEGRGRERLADPDPGKEPQTRRRAGLAESGRRAPTGRRRRSAPRPACSTSAPRAPSASITSTMRTTSRKAGAATIAAGELWASMIQAIDYKTGKVRWTHKWETGGSRSGIDDHRRKPGLHRRRLRQSGRAQCGHRQCAVARQSGCAR